MLLLNGFFVLFYLTIYYQFLLTYLYFLLILHIHSLLILPSSLNLLILSSFIFYFSFSLSFIFLSFPSLFLLPSFPLPSLSAGKRTPKEIKDNDIVLRQSLEAISAADRCRVGCWLCLHRSSFVCHLLYYIMFCVFFIIHIVWSVCSFFHLYFLLLPFIPLIITYSTSRFHANNTSLSANLSFLH